MTKQLDDHEWVIIYRPYRRTRDGRILWARTYGLRAWPIRVPRKRY